MLRRWVARLFAPIFLATPAAPGQTSEGFAPSASSPDHVYVLTAGERGATCRSAAEAEAREFLDAGREAPLHFIKGGDAGAKAGQAVAGLNIQLRATAQLENYPDAKAAFIRAAERWESVLLDSAGIIIDVDFGPTAFGAPFSSASTLGVTFSDPWTGPYSALRPKLLAKHPSAPLYQLLPTTSVPTDHGSATTAAATSASLRSLGVLPATQGSTDPAPRIAFNSAQPFDFTPEDGIGFAKYDFDSIATHEMGHALGFISEVGDLELHPTHPVTVSTWDIFRFRTDVTTSTFTTASRILSSGGDQIFFDSVDRVPLSTGRAEDGSGGDEHQASHWKDASLLGSYIGIMDPTLPSGAHEYMTGWDLLALGFVGWSMGSSSFNQAWISSVTPDTFEPGDPASTITVDGSSFASGASVLWKGSARSTTFVSETRLTAGLSATDLASPGVASVEVVNPGAIPSNMKFVSIGSAPNSCVASSTTLCLAGGRFGVTASWQKPDGTSGSGHAVPLTADTGYFWFFDASNIETITKVLNGCGLTNAYWVFIAGLTNVRVDLTYTDFTSQTSKGYSNPQGTPFQPVQDTSAFKTCP